MFGIKNALKLSNSIVKAALAAWIGDGSLLKAGATTTLDIISDQLTDELSGRRIAREFDAGIDKIAASLRPMVFFEAKGLTDEEVHNCTNYVSRLFDDNYVSIDLILNFDLYPSRLYEHMLSFTNFSHHSGDETELIKRLLKESCKIFIDINLDLPDFQTAKSKLDVRSSNIIINSIEKISDKIERIYSELQKAQDESSHFEANYCEAIVRVFDRLELLGLNVNLPLRGYSLTTAYVNISVERLSPLEVQNGGEPAGVGFSPRAVNVIAEESRLLLLGDPGSGKSTFVQWVAVMSALQNFHGELEHFNSKIPFVIRLREYAEKELPKVDELIHALQSYTMNVPPRGWIRNKLKTGNAILLVDGVDELPENKRQSVFKWIGEFTSSFPKCNFVVTSRPPAVPEGWLDEMSFQSFELLPMSHTDINKFIENWHSAASEFARDEEEKRFLTSLEKKIKNDFEDYKRFQTLASTPLLCAMMCLLNYEMSAQLPRERMELYKIIIETLIDRREIVRKVAFLQGEHFASQDKELILRDIAYWMSNNITYEASIEDLIHIVTNKLANMRHVTSSPEKVVSALLIRSGLLKEPSKGTVSFTHRSFQEYLAAKEYAEGRYANLLLKRAPSDDFWEITLFACGHAGSRYARVIISGLIEKAQQATSDRDKLSLLAAACTETVREIDSETLASVQKNIARLIPPKSLLQAQMLSIVKGAEEFMVPSLHRTSDMSAQTAQASIRALALIGGANAYQAIRSFSDDSRVGVVKELMRGWSFFDEEVFASDIVSKFPLTNGTIEIDSSTQLAALKFCNNAKRVFYRTSRAQMSRPEVRNISLETYVATSGNRRFKEIKEAVNFSFYESNLIVLDADSFQGLDEFMEYNNLMVFCSPRFSFTEHLTRVENVNLLTISTKLPEAKFEPLKNMKNIQNHEFI